MGSGNPELLRQRIAAVLVDDEEFIEEIYLDVNFSVDTVCIPEYAHEKSGTAAGCDHAKTNIMRFHVPQFRLVEVIETVGAMERAGLVTSRLVAGFPDECGVTARMYRLTQLGERYYNAAVRDHVESVFRLE